jgi:hypothetical protein
LAIVGLELGHPAGQSGGQIQEKAERRLASTFADQTSHERRHQEGLHGNWQSTTASRSDCLAPVWWHMLQSLQSAFDHIPIAHGLRRSISRLVD